MFQVNKFGKTTRPILDLTCAVIDYCKTMGVFFNLTLFLCFKMEVFMMASASVHWSHNPYKVSYLSAS